MRKIIWCCVAGVVAYTLAVCCTVGYVWYHPHSRVARAAHATFDCLAQLDPMVQLSKTVGRQVYQTAHGTMKHGKVVSDAVAKMHKSPVPAATLPESSPFAQELRRECEAAIAAGHKLGKIVIQEPEAFQQAAHEAPEVMVGVEEAEVVPAPMPRVVDESEDAGKMDRVTDEPASDEKPGDDKAKMDPVEEQSVGTEEPPMSVEPYYPDYHSYQDYHHYHDYHSGCCPYSGKCPCSEPPMPMTQSSEEESEACPCSPPAPKKTKSEKSKKTSKPGSPCPGHPEVDTMEFRPSDAPPGYFDKVPY